MNQLFSRNLSVLLSSAMILAGCKSTHTSPVSNYSHFVGLNQFDGFTTERSADGEIICLSPVIQADMDWNQLVVSWNAQAPAGTWLKVEARAVASEHKTRFYTMVLWSPDNSTVARTSFKDQRDNDGNASVDTLTLKRPATAAQLRITLGANDDQLPKLKFLGLSFCNTEVAPKPSAPNETAWGKIISTPERSQKSYPQQQGWCSPTSLSMDLARWSKVLHRPELDIDVPEVAAAVYDKSYDGTGNWPFNTAFAGSFDGMRSYVTRLEDLSEVEDWIAAGIPVIMSARWDLLKPGRPLDLAGHLVVCIGFTETGDVVINDPATNLAKDTVRRIYKREDVINAWKTSHNTVYLVFPESARIPRNRYGHW